MEINFLPFKHYQIYQARPDGWYLLRWQHHPVNYSWKFDLTPKQIVYEFFRIAQGTLGYYLVNLKTKRYYHCGVLLDNVKIILNNENGLIKEEFVSNRRARIPQIVEEFINITEDLGSGTFVYKLVSKTLIPYDACSKLGNTYEWEANKEDWGITRKELYKRFLSINGGKPGFYIYKVASNEVLYSRSKNW